MERSGREHDRDKDRDRDRHRYKNSDSLSNQRERRGRRDRTRSRERHRGRSRSRERHRGRSRSRERHRDRTRSRERITISRNEKSRERPRSDSGTRRNDTRRPNFGDHGEIHRSDYQSKRNDEHVDRERENHSERRSRDISQEEGNVLDRHEHRDRKSRSTNRLDPRVRHRTRSRESVSSRRSEPNSERPQQPRKADVVNTATANQDIRRGSNETGYHTDQSRGSSGSPKDGSTGNVGEDREIHPGSSITRGRGGGRGRGRGRGTTRGARGGRAARAQREQDQFDLVATRDLGDDGKPKTKTVVTETNGLRMVPLQSNFFQVASRPNWSLFHYRVDFNPEVNDTKIKKKMVTSQKQALGANIFDGSSLYTSHPLDPDPMFLYCKRDTDSVKYELKVRLVAQLAHTDVMYLSVFNILIRKCLEMLRLEQIGRHFYDAGQSVPLSAHRLELWPGYKTSMRNHEHGILLGVEITHKVLRTDNCLQAMRELQGNHRNEEPGRLQQRIRDEFLGNVVMTMYNKKTYRVDDIDWDTTPLHTFDMCGKSKSFMDYFKEQYGLQIRDGRQPMLVSGPKKKDFHRGNSGPILLVPELCRMTGLTDAQRANNNLMRAKADLLNVDPATRVTHLQNFMSRLKQEGAVSQELQRWGLQFKENLVKFRGHVIPRETIRLGDGQTGEPDTAKDWGWGHAFRSKPMLSSVPLRTWAVIVPVRDAHVVERLVHCMQRLGTPMKFPISNPITIHKIHDMRANAYAGAVDTLMNEHKENIQLIFAILPRQANDTYSAVKRRACIEFGVPSQCMVARNAHNEKGLVSIVSKLIIQMNAKLGGEPWSVKIPVGKLMVVGFDVHHCGKRKGPSVGAMVATTSDTQAKYFSTVSKHQSRDEFSDKMGADFTCCLHAYSKINNCLPSRIIFYRDGVGDGQLKYVHETELKKILEALESVYSSRGLPTPKFSFIVVTKRINARLFSTEGGQAVNPEPGTVADDVITLPERYDFYLVSQYCRRGTVSPVSYNVIYDRQGLDPDKMQRLTFKLCHLYFNWSGTVAVPAPCQYARKLAYLTGQALRAPSHERLANFLYYL